MTPAKRKQQELALRVAMTNLAANPHFQAFIDTLRKHRDVVVQDACNDAVVANQRMSMAAIGEIRAYGNIIAEYEDWENRIIEEAAQSSGE